MKISERYLTALLEISQEINSIQNPNTLLERILEIALQQLSAERGFILLREDGDTELIPKVARNIDPEQKSDFSEISSSVVEKVIKTQQPILTYDVQEDSSFDASESVLLHEIRSIACVPLMLKGQLIGVIYIDSRGKTAGFDKQSLAFLEAFANQSAIAIENARLMESLRSENELLKGEFHRIYAFKEIIARSKSMEQVLQLMGKVLSNTAVVLITGETGTGKELVARAIHYNGPRKDKPFVPVNCAAIPENLLESELFGYKKGAFTGAATDKKGLIELANGGTLFLDEIGELPLSLQVKLLRFLQEREIMRLGDERPIKVDVRIITATHRNLKQEVTEGRFREDLFYRLNVIEIHLPPLRERKKDIPLLAQHFLKKYSKQTDKQVKGFTPEALDKLINYAWPGNVRELENTIERAVILASHQFIEEEDIVLSSVADNSEIEPGMTLEEVSRILLQKTLNAFDGNKTKAAEAMGVSLRWVHYKMKEWNLS
ncbi:MAG: GAF domain-containing protein [Calditrichaeota bacterium]|nr:MAG: GAF domain-containing protein [Calditrichota bacterium]